MLYRYQNYIVYFKSFTPSSNAFLVYMCVYNSEGVSWSRDSHHSGSHWPDELSVIQQWLQEKCLCPWRWRGSRSGNWAGKRKKEKKKSKIVFVQLSTTFSYGVKNQAAHITQVNGALLGRLVHWRVSHHCEVLQVLNTLGSVLGLNKNEEMRQWASLQM